MAVPRTLLVIVFVLFSFPGCTHKHSHADANTDLLRIGDPTIRSYKGETYELWAVDDSGVLVEDKDHAPTRHKFVRVKSDCNVFLNQHWEGQQIEGSYQLLDWTKHADLWVLRWGINARDDFAITLFYDGSLMRVVAVTIDKVPMGKSD